MRTSPKKSNLVFLAKSGPGYSHVWVHPNFQRELDEAEAAKRKEAQQASAGKQ